MRPVHVTESDAATSLAPAALCLFVAPFPPFFIIQAVKAPINEVRGPEKGLS